MKKRIYLTLIIIFFIILLMIVFIISPLFYKIKNSSRELILQKEKLISLETKMANLEKFKILNTDIQFFLKEVDNLFVDSKVPIGFIDFLENISKKHYLEVEILSVSEKQAEKDSWPYFLLRIVSVGSLSDFLKFLEKMENGPYLIELQSININKLAEEKELSPEKIKVTFSIKVFVK